MATLEEAQQCPRCNRPGELGATRGHPSRPGHKLVDAYCRNPLCPWLDTPWVIMLLPDGSVPDPAPPGVARGEKVYGDPLTGEAKIQSSGITTSMIEKINAQAANIQRGTSGGAEI